MTAKWPKPKQQEVYIDPYDRPPPKKQMPYKLPTDPAARKKIPVHTGFINYFPRAIAAVAQVSLTGGIQHGQTPETLHWDRAKSGDELDALMRHVIDEDWPQVAWRALAHLEKHLESKERES